MKRKLSLALGLALGLMVNLNVHAQSEPTKPSYENKVYQANGNYYVQKSLPVYLNFSVTPGGTQYPLKSNKNPKDANPLYLDTEGINYIRSHWAVDPETGKPVVPQREVLMEMYADGLPPRTRIRMSGAPNYRSGGLVYYGKGLQFSLSSSDGVSGVSETKYALNGGYSAYSSNVSISKEGAQTVYYYSADNVGNAENTRSSTFTFDVTPTVSNHSIDGIVHNGNILAPSTRFRLATTDNLAGVNHVHYVFDSGSKRNYGSSISMSGLSDGEHTLYYYGEDNVKNEASPKEFKFYLDRIAPEVSYEVIGDMYVGNYRYVSERTQLKLSATDNKAGVKQIYYRMDGGSSTSYSSNFNFPNKLGYHEVKYYADDNVENRRASKTVGVFLDNRAPETGINYGGPQFFNRDTLFITSNTPITLRARDAHSGVQTVSYGIDGGGKNAYSKFTLSGEGNHSIAFNAVDKVNNAEAEKTSRAFVDNTAPKIFINFSIDPIGSKGGLKIYPNYVRMYIGATDKHVGTEKVLYSIDGAPLRAYSSSQTLDVSELSAFRKRKKYTVKVVTEDKLGNRSEKIIEFYVGRGE